LLKTATPADFNNSSNLAWHYIIRNGIVWQLDENGSDSAPYSQDEQEVLKLLLPEQS
jgi:hypothetical protein